MELRTAAANGALCTILPGDLDSPSTLFLRAPLRGSNDKEDGA